MTEEQLKDLAGFGRPEGCLTVYGTCQMMKNLLNSDGLTEKETEEIFVLYDAFAKRGRDRKLTDDEAAYLVEIAKRVM